MVAVRAVGQAGKDGGRGGGKRAAEAGVTRLIAFGEGKGADVRLVAYRGDGARAQVTASVFGEPLEYSLDAPGRHQAMNSLAVIGAACRLAIASSKRI